MAQYKKSFFSGKNKNFLQLLFLCVVVFGLFAGVIIVSNKNAVLKRSSAATCAQIDASCLNLACCTDTLACGPTGTCICNTNKCRLGCFDGTPTECVECEKDADCSYKNYSGYHGVGYHCQYRRCTSSCQDSSECPDGWSCRRLDFDLSSEKTCQHVCRTKGQSCYLTNGCCSPLTCSALINGTCGLPTPTPTPFCLVHGAKCSWGGTSCCNGTCTLNSSGYYSCP
jgi:hypothetical protein